MGIELSVPTSVKEDIRIVVHGIPVNQEHLILVKQTLVAQVQEEVNVRHGSLQNQIQETVPVTMQ